MAEVKEEELTQVQKDAREYVGDSKLPNKYFVTVSTAYYYKNCCDDGTSVWDWINDLDLSAFEDKGKTIREFKTYREAVDFIDQELSLGVEFEGIKVHDITIEDRFTGELFERAYYFDPNEATIVELTTEDTDFTKEEMEKLGAKFE